MPAERIGTVRTEWLNSSSGLLFHVRTSAYLMIDFAAAVNEY